MKNRTHRWAFASLAAMSLASLGSVASAQTLTWNSTSSGTGPVGGTGTWNTSNTNWWNGTANQAWSAGNIAWFGVGSGTGSSAGTVTVTGSVNAGGITFGPSGTTARYTLTSGTIGLTSGASILLSGSATAPANSTSNATAVSTINSRLIANNLTIGQRSGETSAVGLTLGGSNSFTGTLTIGNASFLSITSANSLGSADVNVNSGGSLSINSAGTYANNFLIAGTGPVGSNYSPLRFASGTAATVLTGTITFGGGDISIGGQGTITGQNSNVVIVNALTGTVGTLSFIQTGTIQLLAKTAFTTTSGTIFRQTGSLTLDAGNETLPAGTVLTFPNNSATKLVLGGTANGAMTQTVNMGSPGTTSTTVVGGASGTSTLVVTGMNASTAVGFSLGGAGSNENNVGLTVDMGAATLYWTGGANTYTGPTQVLSGRLAIGPSNGGTGGRLSPSTSVAISSGATLLFNNNSGTYGGAVGNTISGAGTLQLGSGTLTLSGSNSYSGGTVLQAAGSVGQAGAQGVLVLGNSNALGSSSNSLTISGSGGVDLGGFSISQGAVSVSVGAGMGVPTIGNGTLTASSFAVSNASGTANFTANLISAGGLTKTGVGLLAISGSNSLTGTTAINAGTVQLGNAFALGGSGDIGFGGGTLQFSGSGTPDVSAQVKNSASAMLFDTNGQSVTFATPLASSNTGGLTKLGSGTLTIPTGNGYAGTTTISAGVLRVGGSGTAFGTGTVSLGNAAGAALDLNGQTVALAGLTGGGATGGVVQLNSGTAVLGNLNTSVAAGSVSFAGPGGIVKNGAGILTLSPALSSTVSALTINQGRATVSPAAGTTLNLGTVSRTAGGVANFTIGGGTITASNSLSNGIIGPWAVSGSTGATGAYVTIASGTVATYTGATQVSTSGGMADTSGTTNFDITGTTSVAVSGAFSANTIRSATTNSASLTWSGTQFMINGYVYRGNGGYTAFGSAGGTPLTIGANRDLVLYTAHITPSSSFAVNSAIADNATGTSSVTLISNGQSMSLLGANTFTGDINFTSLSTSSTLTLGNGSTHAATTANVTMSPGGTLVINNNGAQSIGSITGVGTAFTKTGTGVLTMSSAASSFSGTVSINNGTVAVSTLGAAGVASSLGTSGTITVGANASLRYIGSGNSTTDRVVALSGTAGTLDAGGSGAIVFTSTSAYATGTNALTLTGTSTADNAFGTITNSGSGSTTLVKTGVGRWVSASANNTFAGGVQVQQGQLILAADTTGDGAGSLGAEPLSGASAIVGSNSLSGTAALLLKQGVTVGGRIINVAGSATQVAILGGSNTSGTATFANTTGSEINLARDVQLQAATNGTVVFNNAWSFTGGSGRTVTVGSVGNAGRVVLSGSLGTTGAVNVNFGTLAVNGSIPGASAVTVASGAVLGGSGRIGSSLGGDGLIAPGNSPGILQVDGQVTPTANTAFAFEFTQAGDPTWSNASASVNDVLRLTNSSPFQSPLSSTNIVNVYFDVASLASGDIFSGGFYSDRTSGQLDFTSAIGAPTYAFFVYGDGNGSATSYNGKSYYTLAQYDPSLTGATATVVTVPTADFANGTVTNGQVTQFVVVPEPATLALAAIGIGLGGWAALRRRKNRV